MFSFINIFQQKLAKREVGTIDRSQDVTKLQEFYKHYREKHNVDRLREEETKLRESGAFTGNLSEYVCVLEEIAHLNDLMLSLPSSSPWLHCSPMEEVILCNLQWVWFIYCSVWRGSHFLLTLFLPVFLFSCLYIVPFYIQKSDAVGSATVVLAKELVSLIIEFSSIYAVS